MVMARLLDAILIFILFLMITNVTRERVNTGY